jgi:hypothetical protein
MPDTDILRRAAGAPDRRQASIGEKKHVTKTPARLVKGVTVIGHVRRTPTSATNEAASSENLVTDSHLKPPKDAISQSQDEGM